MAGRKNEGLTWRDAAILGPSFVILIFFWLSRAVPSLKTASEIVGWLLVAYLFGWVGYLLAERLKGGG